MLEQSAADGLTPSAAPAALQNQAPPDRGSADDKSSFNRGVEPEGGESSHLTCFPLLRRHDFWQPLPDVGMAAQPEGGAGEEEHVPSVPTGTATMVGASQEIIWVPQESDEKHVFPDPWLEVEKEDGTAMWFEDEVLQSRLTDLRAYRAATGHACPTTREGPLGRWISALRSRNRRGELSKELVALLLAEGVVFEAEQARALREQLEGERAAATRKEKERKSRAEEAGQEERKSHRMITKPRRFIDESEDDEEVRVGVILLS